MPIEKVNMQSPDGEETREVDATEKVLVPLMLAGWKQVPAPELKTNPGGPMFQGAK
jgi:hypothetical protein